MCYLNENINKNKRKITVLFSFLFLIPGQFSRGFHGLPLNNEDIVRVAGMHSAKNCRRWILKKIITLDKYHEKIILCYAPFKSRLSIK